MAAKKETQAEKNARIQKELASRGAKFQTKAQIDAQRDRAGKKREALAKQPAKQPVARGGNGEGGATKRRAAGYFSGKTFDEDMDTAQRRSGAK